MKTTNKILGIVAFLLLVGAAVTAQRSLHIIRRYRWTVLEQPVRLEDGFSVSRPFTVDVAGTYWVQLACRKTVPFVDQMLATKLAAEYTITSGPNQIDAGNTSQPLDMGYTNDYVEHRIATFTASPGTEYNLALRITTNLPEFASTRPTVKVSIEPWAFTDAYVHSSITAYLALGLALMGLLCCVPIARSFFRSPPT